MAGVQLLSSVLLRAPILTLSLYTQDYTGLALSLPGSDGTGSQAVGLPKAWGTAACRAQSQLALWGKNRKELVIQRWTSSGPGVGGPGQIPLPSPQGFMLHSVGLWAPARIPIPWPTRVQVPMLSDHSLGAQTPCPVLSSLPDFLRVAWVRPLRLY